MAALFALLFAFQIVFSHCVPLTWREIPATSASSPPPLELPGIGYYAALNQIIVFGGRGENGNTNTLWICTLQNTGNNTEECNWLRVPTSNPPARRFSMVAGVYEKGGLFIISTGEGSGRTHFNDIWYFDLNGGNRWEEVEVQGVRPSVRYGAVGGIHHEGDIFAVSHGFASSVRTSDTFFMNVSELTNSNGVMNWRLAAGPFSSYELTGPHPRCLAAGTMITPTVLVMYGGCLNTPLLGAGGPCPSFDSWKLDFTTGQWIRLPNCVSPRLFVAMSYLPNETAVLFAGNTLGLRVPTVGSGPIIPEEVDVLDLNSDFVWTRRRAEQISGNIPVWRERHSMTSGNGKVYMFGGEDFSTEELLNDLWSIEGKFSENVDIGCPNHFFSISMMHGLLMFLGWGVFLQLGAFIARYLRFRAPLWFHLHRIFQVTGLGIAIIGFILAFFQTSFPLFWHAAIGIIIMIIGIQQPINGIFRPHIEPGKKPTIKRLIWSYFHIYAGRFALLLAIINITLGLFLILAPDYIWGIWFAMLISYAILYIVFEIIKQYYDYQKRKQAKGEKVDSIIEVVTMEPQDQSAGEDVKVEI
ncbi:Cytochrome b561 and DOMON domain-containing protein [Oopsacas minuta]|uniref:Cytochrome b561 and DOMON domain-containing protein n=1 Tax=Oopsacas minuta TaxID=111878 RepID=A0AAV7JR94_9METZ|nr:Cytochrome b561 and DOMON domain-containing protein [Oopsacas minuta]